MPLNITTLSDSLSQARTFVLLGRDRTSSEWLFTNATNGIETRLTVKTQTVGSTKNKQGAQSPIRRSLVQLVSKVPSGPDANYAGHYNPEQIVTVNFTMTAPENGLVNPNMTLEVKQDVAAFLESFLSNTTIEQLARGEV